MLPSNSIVVYAYIPSSNEPLATFWFWACQDKPTQRFSFCEHGDAYAMSEVAEVNNIMRKVSPSGVTPLTQHIWDIQQQISAMAHDLRKKQKRVALILATDGLPTDEHGYGGQEITNAFVRALWSLEGLPIWIVIRLCTDEAAVTEFYNSLDEELELNLEVVDEYKSEAKEVYVQRTRIPQLTIWSDRWTIVYERRSEELLLPLVWDRRRWAARSSNAFWCISWKRLKYGWTQNSFNGTQLKRKSLHGFKRRSCQRHILIKHALEIEFIGIAIYLCLLGKKNRS